MDAAKYRLTAKEITFVDAVPHSPGSEFVSITWPDLLKVEPINDTARTIAAYLEKHRHDSRRPQHLFSKNCDGPYLPALDCIPVPDADAAPEAPRYVNSHFDEEFRMVTVPAERAFTFLQWPSEGWEAINESAQLVLDYFTRHRDDPRLPVAPVCLLNGVVLPELPELPDRSAVDDQVSFADLQRSSIPSAGRFLPDR